MEHDYGVGMREGGGLLQAAHAVAAAGEGGGGASSLAAVLPAVAAAVAQAGLLDGQVCVFSADAEMLSRCS